MKGNSLNRLDRRWLLAVLALAMLSTWFVLVGRDKKGTTQHAEALRPDRAAPSASMAPAGDAEASKPVPMMSRTPPRPAPGAAGAGPLDMKSPLNRSSEGFGIAPAESKPGDDRNPTVRALPVTPPRLREPDAAARLAQARRALTGGDPVAARTNLSAALKAGLRGDDAAAARRELSRITAQTLLSASADATDPLVKLHTVRSGELLTQIARRYRVTPALLTAINAIADPNQIRAGARLKVLEGPFNLVIDRTGYTMDVYLRGTPVLSMRVGLGRNNSTPVGRWRVLNKLKNPSWVDPESSRRYGAEDPQNPIGERWIGLEGIGGDAVGKIGYGIHGTIEPDSIGGNASLGCVRLTADDVARVFDLLVEGHSTVEIR